MDFRSDQFLEIILLLEKVTHNLSTRIIGMLLLLFLFHGFFLASWKLYVIIISHLIITSYFLMSFKKSHSRNRLPTNFNPCAFQQFPDFSYNNFHLLSRECTQDWGYVDPCFIFHSLVTQLTYFTLFSKNIYFPGPPAKQSSLLFLHREDKK